VTQNDSTKNNPFFPSSNFVAHEWSTSVTYRAADSSIIDHRRAIPHW
jgi:hypothetical protein